MPLSLVFMQEAELKLAATESENVTPLELEAVVPETFVSESVGFPCECVLFAKVLLLI